MKIIKNSLGRYVPKQKLTFVFTACIAFFLFIQFSAQYSAASLGQCTSSSQCSGSTPVCSSGICVQCATNGDCSNSCDVCSGNKCVMGGSCDLNSQCGASNSCVGSNRICSCAPPGGSGSTCSGSTSSQCQNYYGTCQRIGTSPYALYCLNQIQTDAGWACQANTGTATCGACVPNDSACTFYKTLPNGTLTTNCTVGVDCDQCGTTWSGNPAGCGNAAYKLCGNGCVGGTTGGGGGGGGGGGTCTPVVNKTYYECETSTFGACGYLYTNHGNKPAWDYVMQDSCGGYTCNDENKTCDQTISGHVFLDTNRNGVQDSGEPNITAALASTIELSDAADGVSYSTITDGSGNYILGNGKNTTAYGQLLGATWSVGVSGPPANYQATTGFTSVTVSFASQNPSNINFGIVPNQYTISGTVYSDLDHDGVWNNNDAAYAGSTLTILATDSNGNLAAQTTTSNGAYSLLLNWGSKYTISIQTLPGNYSQTTGNPVFDLTVASPSNATNQNIGISPLYKIQGIICLDNGITGSCAGNSVFPGSQNITITPNIANGTTAETVTSNAYQTGVRVLSGTYTVSYTPPSGYYFTASKVPGKTLPPFKISVGQSTAVDGSGNVYTCAAPPVGTTDASCDAGGDIINLNFAISNLQAWSQGWCTDLRLEAPGMDLPVPNTGSCTDATSGTSTPNGYAIICLNNNAGAGVYYSGANSPTFGYNNGQASLPNYLVGGSSYPETFTPVSGINRASYDYLMQTITQSGTPTTDLSSPANALLYCGAGGTGDCDLSNSLPDGIYTVNGDLTLDMTHPLPDPGNNKSFVFLVSGKLNIDSNILVPTDSSVVFASKDDMSVAGNVGVATYTDPTPNLEGFYSTEGNFWILSNNNTGFPCASGGTPIDERLNIAGAVIVGGTVQNQRELCKYDSQCPVTTYSTNYNYILNAPEFVKHKAQLWQEKAPNGQ